MDKDLHSVLKAVGNIIEFYQRDYKNLNIDGLFGLRVLEGKLCNMFSWLGFITTLFLQCLVCQI